MTIGKTIWQQMNALDKNLIWCMGVSKLVGLENGLRFNVNGRVFKGTVEITLNVRDLYDIKLIKISRKLNDDLKAIGIKKYETIETVICTINDIYAEDMMNIMGEKIEFGEVA